MFTLRKTKYFQWFSRWTPAKIIAADWLSLVHSMLTNGINLVGLTWYVWTTEIVRMAKPIIWKCDTVFLSISMCSLANHIWLRTSHGKHVALKCILHFIAHIAHTHTQTHGTEWQYDDKSMLCKRRPMHCLFRFYR